MLLDSGTLPVPHSNYKFVNVCVPIVANIVPSNIAIHAFVCMATICIHHIQTIQFVTVQCPQLNAQLIGFVN